MSRTHSRKGVEIGAIYVAYLAILVVFLGPILLMLWGSVHKSGDIASSPPNITAPATLNNYLNLFSHFNFGRDLVNSLIIAGGSTIIGLAAGSAAAHCITSLNLRLISILTLVARMAPGVLFLIPLRVIAARLGALDSVPRNYALLILVHLIITLPLSVWLLTPFFEGIPKAMQEAAEIDGCSLPRIFWSITLPIVRPGLAVAAVISFIFSWNYFLFALALANVHTLPLTVVAFNFIGIGQYDWGGLMAAAVVIATPTTVLAFIAQRFLVRGLSGGAVK